MFLYPQAGRFWGTKMIASTAAEVAEPFMPPFGILGFLLTVNVVLFMAALISIARNRKHTSGGKVVWASVVLALPVLGPVAWFLIGRRAPSPRESPLRLEQ
jgi:amino acid transporter